MSQNWERDFSLKDWVTKRAANAPDPTSDERMADIMPVPMIPVKAPANTQKIIQDKEEEAMRPAALHTENSQAENTDPQSNNIETSKIESMSQITARISNVAAAPATSPTQQIQIVRLLRDLGDRLRQSEKEREILWRELDGCRKLLTDIEDKANKAEKAYLSIEHKISHAEPDNKEEAKEFKKSVESKLTALETTAGSAILRLEDAVAENSKLARRLDQIAQDKVRMQRKMETLEETLTQTQDSLKAKALVLLTDHALAARTNLPQMPAYTAQQQSAVNAQFPDQNMPWWKNSSKKKISTGAFAAVVLIALGLAAGWAISRIEPASLKSFSNNLNSSATSSQSAAKQTGMPTDQNKLMDDIAKMANNVEPGDVAKDAPATSVANSQPTQKLPGEDALKAISAPEDQVSAPDASAATVATAPATAASTPDEAQAIAAAAEKKAIDAFNAEKPKGDLKSRIEADKNLPAVVTEIETKAFNGDAEAQHDLAAIYTAGHAGVKTDYARALKWFTEAAHNGIANAQYNLGVLYQQGLGVKPDTAKAISLYRVAAANNHPEAQYNLGIAHMEGVGAEYNPQVAAYYFERAASGGVVEAAYNLGLIQENGLLGESQPDEAVFWYKLAADHGNKQAQQALDQMTKQLGMKDEDVKRIFGRIYAQRPDALKVVSASAQAETGLKGVQ